MSEQVETPEGRELPHILLRQQSQVSYRVPPKDYSKSKNSFAGPANRAAHGAGLAKKLDASVAAHAEVVRMAGLHRTPAEDFLYLHLQIADVARFKVSSLEPDTQHTGIRITAKGPTQADGSGDFVVCVPLSKLQRFQRQLANYIKTATDEKPASVDQMDRWKDVNLAGVRHFYTDHDAFPPEGEEHWWEVHLFLDEKGAADDLDRLFRHWAQGRGLQVLKQALAIDGRLILWVAARPEDFTSALLVLGHLAELRRAREWASPYLQLGNADQRDFTDELADRLQLFGANPPAVCVVDSGANRAHTLLEPFLAASDQHTHLAAWGVDDAADPAFVGHGTNMCGIGLFGGGLPQLLRESAPVEIRHRLESVKIFPRSGGNKPVQVPLILAASPTGPEIAAPERRRVFVLAVSSQDTGAAGTPSLDAAVLDALAVGRIVDADAKNSRLVSIGTPDPQAARLWVVATGNVREGFREDLEARSGECPVEPPGEAWNVLTVGAMTELDRVPSPPSMGLAARGALSPFSRTSGMFDDDRPVKPEIVMEGGNLTGDAEAASFDQHKDLSLLTTHHEPIMGQFASMAGTSPAAAQAARLIAILLAERPDLRPETIRGLMVHAARWTPAMRAAVNAVGDSKKSRLRLLRRYGWGVPDAARLLRSLRHQLTLISEERIAPFDADGKYAGMKFHPLPWPRKELMSMGDVQVRLRVTLSTFIDPHVARRGRYGYPSHQFRFDLKRPTEDIAFFRKKVNATLRDPAGETLDKRAKSKWFFGTDARTRGGVFSDTWTGNAADLAECGELAVIPVTGWWKDQGVAKEARYSLLTSIEVDDPQVDFATEVEAEIEAMASVPVNG